MRSRRERSSRSSVNRLNRSARLNLQGRRPLMRRRRSHLITWLSMAKRRPRVTLYVLTESTRLTRSKTITMNKRWDEGSATSSPDWWPRGTVLQKSGLVMVFLNTAVSLIDSIAPVASLLSRDTETWGILRLTKSWVLILSHRRAKNRRVVMLLRRETNIS